MRCPTWVRAAEIDDWSKSTRAKFVLPELMRRLVLATVERENLKAISFPAHEEAQRHGYDGRTSTDRSTTHVPPGPCVLELSCETNPASKAQRDYETRVRAGENEDLSQVSYAAVTARD